jgi:ribosomal protein L15
VRMATPAWEQPAIVKEEEGKGERGARGQEGLVARYGSGPIRSLGMVPIWEHV